MPYFRKFPPEIRNRIWALVAGEAEIISVEVIRPIIAEVGKNKTIKVNGVLIPREISMRYEAFGARLSLDGSCVTREDGEDFFRYGMLGACKESKAIYLHAKPNFLRLKQGSKIYFNADTDIIAIPRRTRFNLNQQRQRQRPPMVFFKGWEQIKRVVYVQETDEETTLELLSDQVNTDFAESIVELEEELFEGANSKYVMEDGWTKAVDMEQARLAKELKDAAVRLALQKVNGTVFSNGISDPKIKILFFPLKKDVLEEYVVVEAA